MQLDARKDMILKAVIDGYIRTADPVGSRTIAKKFNIGLSSATIRNEMADLEELGYLEQPHTSAGRIPSVKGYRYYVDSILNEMLRDSNKVNEYDRHIIDDILKNADNEIDEIIKRTAKILSSMTRYTSLVLAPQANRSKIKALKLMPIDERNMLLTVVTNTGLIKNTVFETDKYFDSLEQDRINNILNRRLYQLSLDEIDDHLLEDIKIELNDEKLLRKIIDIIKNSLVKADDEDILTDGATNIFNYPEYHDINRVKDFMSLLEEKSLLFDVLEPSNYQEMKITIGSENKYKETKDVSLIIAMYRLNGKPVGSIGIVGPTRMDYKKVIHVVNMVKNDLCRLLECLFGI